MHLDLETREVNYILNISVDGEGREGGDRREGRDGGRDSGRERGGRSSGDGKDRQECYQCGSTRHFKRDCPELNKSRSRSRDKLKRDKKKKSNLVSFNLRSQKEVNLKFSFSLLFSKGQKIEEE